MERDSRKAAEEEGLAWGADTIEAEIRDRIRGMIEAIVEEELEAALGAFKARGVSRVYLEVRESNAAATMFYEKHGFRKKGTRNGYYRNPDEAAVLLERKLTG